jgi:hypothetical protein
VEHVILRRDDEPTTLNRSELAEMFSDSVHADERAMGMTTSSAAIRRIAA